MDPWRCIHACSAQNTNAHAGANAYGASRHPAEDESLAMVGDCACHFGEAFQLIRCVSKDHCGWELDAAARWHEHVNRLQGLSASGVQSELLRLGNYALDESVDPRGVPRLPAIENAAKTSGNNGAKPREPEMSRPQQHNTPAWVSRAVKTNTTQAQTSASSPAIKANERQGAGTYALRTPPTPGLLPDRYSMFSAERRQDLAVQVMSSLLELASETERLGEVKADDVRRLLMESVHDVVRQLVPRRGQVMGRPTDAQAQRVKELM